MAKDPDDIDISGLDFGKDLDTQIKEDPTGTAKVRALMKRAEQLVEQTQNLYQQYFAGIEKFPPRDRRNALEYTMTQLFYLAKTTPNIRFRYGNLLSKFQTHRDRWDRMLKDYESGKLRRPGPLGRG